MVSNMMQSIVMLFVVAASMLNPTSAQRFTGDCRRQPDLLIKDLNERQEEPWRLGHLYDVRSDTVFGNSVWESATIDEHTTERTTSSQTRSFVHAKTSSVVVDEFEIGLGAQVKILFITIGMSANLKFTLTTTRKTERFLFSQQLRTVTTTLNEDLLGQVLVPVIGTPTGLDVLARLGATHVITSISYGGTLDIAFDAKAKSIVANFDLSGSGLVKGLLQAMNDQGKSGVGPAAPLLSDIDVTVDSDIGFPFPIRNFADSIKTITQFEDLLSAESGGKGVTYAALLTPICRFYDIPVPKSPFRAISTKTDRVVSKLISGQRDSLSRGNQLYDEAKTKGGFLTTMLLLDQWAELLDTYNSKLGVKLDDMLVAVRSFAMEEETILDLCDVASKSPMSFGGSEQWLDSIEQTLNFYDEVDTTITYQLKLANQGGPEEDFGNLFQFATSFRGFSEEFLTRTRNSFGTVVVLAFVPESDSTLNFRTQYLKDVVKSIKEYGSRTGADSALVPKAIFMDQNNLVQTRTKMIEFVELINLVSNGETCIVPPCFPSEKDAFVVVNYSENELDFRAAGVDIDASSIILFRDGVVYNPDFEPCATSDDPRNGGLISDNPPCQYSGRQDVPDGLLCTFGDNVCKNRCGSDNRCRSNQCELREDWFLISNLGNATNHCATTEPQRPGQVTMTLCDEGGPLLTQQWVWSSGQIRNLATEECLTSSDSDSESMQTLPCVESDSQLWQVSANEIDRSYQTRLRLVKYPDKCVTISESVSNTDSETLNVNIVTSDCIDVGQSENVEDLSRATLYEVDENQVIILQQLMRVPYSKDGINSPVELCLQGDDSEGLITADCTGEPNQRFYQAASRDLANEFFWFHYRVMDKEIFGSTADHRAINIDPRTDMLNITDSFTEADTTFGLDDYGRISIRLDIVNGETQCVAHSRTDFSDNTPEVILDDCADPNNGTRIGVDWGVDQMNQQFWYSCFQVCEVDTCENIENSVCVSSFDGTDCVCNEGWKDSAPTVHDCAVKISECIAFPCPDLGLYCQLTEGKKKTAATLQRNKAPVFSAAGRECILLTACNPGEYMSSAPTITSDRECELCPPDTYQYEFNYEGTSCTSVDDGRNVTMSPTIGIVENVTSTEAPTAVEQMDAPNNPCTGSEKLVMPGTSTQAPVCLSCKGQSGTVPVCDPDTRLCFCLDKTFAQTKLSSVFVIVGPEVAKEVPDVPVVIGSLYGSAFAIIVGFVVAKVVLGKRAKRAARANAAD